jgi:hypothetical protein
VGVNLDADATGISHMTNVNGSHIAFFEWRQGLEYPTLLMGSLGTGINVNISIPEAVSFSAIDLLAEKGQVFALYTNVSGIYIEQLYPVRQVLVHTASTFDGSFVIVPRPSVNGKLSTSSKRSIWLLNGVLFFNTLDIDLDGFTQIPVIRYYRVSTGSLVTLCSKCSIIHMRYMGTIARYVISGPTEVIPAISNSPFSVSNTWNTTVFVISETDLITNFGAYSTGPVLNLWTPATADRIDITAFIAPDSTGTWTSVNYISFTSDFLVSDNLAARSDCFYDFKLEEMLAVDPVLTTNSSDGSEMIWMPSIESSGRAIIGRSGSMHLYHWFGILIAVLSVPSFFSGTVDVSRLSASPTKFPVLSFDFSVFVPLFPGSSDAILHYSTSNEAPHVGLFSIATRQTADLADNRQSCMYPMRIQPYGIGYSNGATLFASSTQSLGYSLFVIEHSSKTAHEISFNRNVYTIAFGPSTVPGSRPYAAAGTFVAFSNSSHSEISIVSNTGAIMQSIGIVPTPQAGARTFAAHNFGGAVTVIQAGPRILTYNSDSASLVGAQIQALAASTPFIWGSSFGFIAANGTVFNTSDGIAFSSFYSQQAAGALPPTVCHVSGSLLTCGLTVSEVESAYLEEALTYPIVDSQIGFVQNFSCVGCAVVTLWNNFIIHVSNPVTRFLDTLRFVQVTFTVVDARTGALLTSWNQIFPIQWQTQLKIVKVSDRLFIGHTQANAEIVMLSNAALQGSRKRAPGDAVVFIYSAVNSSDFTVQNNVAGPFEVVGPQLQVVIGNPTYGLPSSAGLNVTILPPNPCVISGDCGSASICSSTFCIPAPPVVPVPTAAPSSSASAPTTTVSGVPSVQNLGCATSAPSSQFTCVGGVWQSTGNVTVPPSGSLVFNGPTYIGGNLIMSPNSTINITVGNPLNVSGCVTFDGTLTAIVPPSLGVSPPQTFTMINHGGPCGQPSTFAAVGSNFQGQDCKKATTQPEYNQRSMSVLFSSVDESGCNSNANGASSFPWWAILIVCLVAALLILTIVILIVKKDKIIPYYKSRSSMLKAKQTIAARQSAT